MANPPMTDNDIAAVVSAAIIGERERCAKIAEQWEHEGYPGNFKTLIERIREPVK